MTKRFAAAVVFLAAAVFQANAATLYVNNGSRPTNCPKTYSKIQDAINNAQNNDTVTVCNGVYNEQLDIEKPINLTAQSGATIQPINAQVNGTDIYSGDPVYSIIYVFNTTGVNISGLIVDGSLANVDGGVGDCSKDFRGIYYANASGSMVHNTVRYVELSPASFGCQQGLAIVADSIGIASTVSIQANSVHDYDKNGITTFDQVTATISGNTVTGIGPTPLIAQNGIQVSFGSTGTVSSNVVTGDVYSLCTSASDPNCQNGSASGILIYDSDGVNISSNTVSLTQGAIVVFADDGNPLNSTISSNKISQTLVYDAIGLYGDGSNVSSNSLVNSAESAIYVAGNNNKINTNTVIEAPIGVYLASGTGNTINGEKNYGVPQQTFTAPPVRATGKPYRAKR